MSLYLGHYAFLDVALVLKDAEVNEKRAKLRAALAQGKPLDSSIANDKALRSNFAYDESRPDLTTNEQLELDDEYSHLSGLVDPRGETSSCRSQSQQCGRSDLSHSSHHHKSRPF